MTRLSAVVVIALLLATAGCESPSDADEQPPAVEQQAETPPTDDQPDDLPGDDRADERERMVTTQLQARDVEDEAVLDAMRTVPRHEYMPREYRQLAYQDSPQPIGHEQTISQPYIVARMTELLDVEEGQRILEIGTGSGYQAAVLAELNADVYTIEIICELAERAEEDLERTGYGDIQVKCGDGYQGWPDHAPFDRIIVTAAPPEIPDALVEQLKVGGKMVVPVGEEGHIQTLQVIEKVDDDDVEITEIAEVRFVPMVPGE